jgi:exoribonuclease R
MTLETKDYLRFNIINDDGECIKTIEGVHQIIPALPGDTIMESGTLIKRTEYPPIVGILHLQSKVRYGMTSKGKPIYLFEPINKSYPLMIAGCGDKTQTTNVIAIVTFESWEKGSKFARASLQKIIGPCGDLDSEREMILHRYSPWPLPKKAEISSQYLEEIEKRQLISGYTFNIDPPGCEDVDDVITMRKISDTSWELIISITDVATAVEEGTPLDLYAKKVGQTLYPDEKQPKHMLPPSISTQSLSLLKGCLRNVISLSITWSPENGLQSSTWLCAKTSVDTVYTYAEAQKEQREEFQVLKRIVNDLAKKTRDTSEEWVETLMVYYNTEAGKLLKANGLGILRHHTEPDMEKFATLGSIDPLLEKMAFSSANYVTPETKGRHWGLDTEDYAHASSPLRRYADLYNQRCLLYILNPSGMKPSQNPRSLCRQLNILQKNSKSFERDEFFITTLAKTKCPVLAPVIIEINEDKQFVKVWVKEWNRIVRIKTHVIKMEEGFVAETKDGVQVKLSVKEKIRLTYHVNYEKACWKDKIIFGIHNYM